MTNQSDEQREQPQAARWLAFAEERVPELVDARRAAAIARMENAYADLRAALAWFVGRGDPERAARMVRALREFWWDTGRAEEGREWIARALASPEATARSLWRAMLLDHAGILAEYTGDRAAARTCLEESLAIRREVGDATSLPVALLHLGWLLRQDGALDAARVLFAEALALSRELGGSPLGSGYCHGNLAMLAIDEADFEAARAHLEQHVAALRQAGAAGAGGLALELFAIIAAHQGQPERALRLAGAGAAYRAAAGVSFHRTYRTWLERGLAPARRALDDARQAAAWAEGQAATVEQALTEALAGPAA